MDTSSRRTRPASFTRRGALTGMGLAAAGVASWPHGPIHAARQETPNERVLWAWSGGVTDSSAVVVAALADEQESPWLALSDKEDLSRAGRVGASNPGADVLRFEIARLNPDTDYWYAVTTEDDTVTSPDGHFRTFPSGAASFTFAFSACAETGSNADVFDTIREHEPLFFLSTGDFVYADVEENDPEQFRAAFDTTLTSPVQSELYRSTALAYIWDDHDFGPNNADSTSPSREAAQQNYRDVVPHYPLPDDGSISQAFTVGRVRFIMTDNYSFRSPDEDEDGPEKTMLGESQKDWLKEELLAANGTFPVIVWVNSQPWISLPGPDGDGWGQFATEREEIASFISANAIRNVVMLSGDAHMLAIDDGTNSNYAPRGGNGFPVFHAAALDRDGSVKGGPYSEGTFPGKGHFGLMTVHDDGGSSIEITWSGRNQDDEEIVRHRFRLTSSSSDATPPGVG